MTTIETAQEQTLTRGEWLDSVVRLQTEPRESSLTRLREWVVGVVYGEDAPSESTYTTFENQSSQVPRFEDAHRPAFDGEQTDERRSPLAE
jgi:hypothetical protein